MKLLSNFIVLSLIISMEKFHSFHIVSQASFILLPQMS